MDNRAISMRVLFVMFAKGVATEVILVIAPDGVDVVRVVLRVGGFD